MDFDLLRRVEPNSKNYQWEVPAFRLFFTFRMPEKGIESYQAVIECRSDGSVINEIDLPEIALHPERASFVSLQDALKSAPDFDAAKTEIEITYRRKEDKCIYRLRQLVRDDGLGLLFKCVDIDAHSGQVIERYQIEGFR